MKRTILIFLSMVCCVAFLAAPTQSYDNGDLRVTGTFVGGGRFAGRTTPFTLTVKSVTPPNQIRALNEALAAAGRMDCWMCFQRWKLDECRSAPASVFRQTPLSRIHGGTEARG